MGLYAPLSTLPLNSLPFVSGLPVIGTSILVPEYDTSTCQLFERRLKSAMSTLLYVWSAFGSLMRENRSNCRPCRLGENARNESVVPGSSALFSTPSGPGSRKETGMLYDEYGRSSFW